jgi:uncharacterized membrane protein
MPDEEPVLIAPISPGMEAQLLVPQIATSSFVVQSSANPWPSPDQLLGYERAIPGAGSLLLEAIRKEQAFQQGETKRRLTLEFVTVSVGQVFGLVIAGLFIGGAIALGYLNQPIPASFLGTSGIAEVVGIFVVGRRRKPQSTTTVQAVMGVQQHPLEPKS